GSAPRWVISACSSTRRVTRWRYIQQIRRMRKVSGLIVWCAMVFCACQAPPVGDIAQAEWLIGTWESKTPEGTVYESWRRTGEKEFSGTSYFINDKDTVVLESIRLV